MKDDRAYLIYILECIANIHELTTSGRESLSAPTAKHNRAAVLYYLQTMAEAAQRLSESLKATHPEIDWLRIGGFRNRLAHGYLDININIIWDVIEHYLDPLNSAAAAMLHARETEPEE